jgi:DNA-directed RNA polymerase subunit RPC12/RpoP
MQLELQCQKCEETFSLEITELQTEPEIRCPGCSAKAATGQVETLIEALDDLFAAIAPLRRKFQVTVEVDSEDLPPPYDEEPGAATAKAPIVDAEEEDEDDDEEEEEEEDAEDDA